MSRESFPEAQIFYHSKEWKRCREQFIAERIAIDGGVCQRCQRELGYIIHHKTEITPENINDSLITMGFDNLEYVCFKCHNIIHFSKDQELNCIFVDGQPQPIPPP